MNLTERGILVLSIAGVGASLLLGVGVTVAVGVPDAPSKSVWITDDSGNSYVLCATEDAPGPCYWGGGANGDGARFFVREDGSVDYVSAVVKQA